jgi:hypothetical protein
VDGPIVVADAVPVVVAEKVPIPKKICPKCSGKGVVCLPDYPMWLQVLGVFGGSVLGLFDTDTCPLCGGDGEVDDDGPEG